jgi:hypothetical protein
MLAYGLMGSVAFTFVSRPKRFPVAIVFARYNIALYLLYFVGLACFVAEIASRVRATLERKGVARAARYAPMMCAAISFAAVVSASPIPRYLAIRPCNFRLHSAFQEYYDGSDLAVPPVSDFHGPTLRVTAETIPRFYRTIPNAGACKLVEYPMEMEDAHIAFYFYQLHHRCEVVVGYSDNDASGQLMQANENRGRLKFRNLAPVDDIAALKSVRADYVVVHVDNDAEVKLRKKRIKILPETRRVLAMLESAFGHPVYEDPWLRVFRPVETTTGL